MNQKLLPSTYAISVRSCTKNAYGKWEIQSDSNYYGTCVSIQSTTKHNYEKQYLGSWADGKVENLSLQVNIITYEVFRVWSHLGVSTYIENPLRGANFFFLIHVFSTQYDYNVILFLAGKITHIPWAFLISYPYAISLSLVIQSQFFQARRKTVLSDLLGQTFYNQTYSDE